MFEVFYNIKLSYMWGNVQFQFYYLAIVGRSRTIERKSVSESYADMTLTKPLSISALRIMYVPEKNRNTTSKIIFGDM